MVSQNGRRRDSVYPVRNSDYWFSSVRVLRTFPSSRRPKRPTRPKRVRRGTRSKDSKRNRVARLVASAPKPPRGDRPTASKDAEQRHPRNVRHTLEWIRRRLINLALRRIEIQPPPATPAWRSQRVRVAGQGRRGRGSRWVWQRTRVHAGKPRGKILGGAVKRIQLQLRARGLLFATKLLKEWTRITKPATTMEYGGLPAILEIHNTPEGRRVGVRKAPKL